MLDDVSVIKAYELIAEINSNQYNYGKQTMLMICITSVKLLLVIGWKKILRKRREMCKHCEVTNVRFVLVKPDSVQFHYDIIFCLESDSIVVSFS